MASSLAPASPAHVVSRVAAALLGGFAFVWGFIAAGMSLLFAAGMEFHDAEFLATLLGVLVFLVALLCTFAARRLWLAWGVLLGGGALLAATASLVQATLV
ncbi:MAG: iron uptake protein [Pseudoxanthomonas sp.]